VTAVIVIIVAVIGILAAFVLKDDNAGMTVTPSADVVKRIFADAITGKASEITASEVNELLAYNMPKKLAGTDGMEGVFLFTNPDDTVSVYLPVTVKGFHLGVTANAKLSFDSAKNQITADIQSVHIGRLGVPAGWAVNFLKDKLPEGVKADGTKITVGATGLTFQLSGLNGKLTLSDLQVKNQKFVVQTTGMKSMIQDYLNKFGSQIQSFLNGGNQNK
jgi:hypothetical protein